MIKELSVEELQTQVENYFRNNDKEDLLIHSLKVAGIAQGLAKKHDVSEEQAYLSGLLHDLGRTLRNEEYVPFCESHGIEVLAEELISPNLLHQKASSVIAKQRFGIHDEMVLEALSVHTTMCPNPSKLSMVLYLADKMSWDPEDNGLFIEEMNAEVQLDLKIGVKTYLNYQFGNLEKMSVLHPLTAAAYEVFCK